MIRPRNIVTDATGKAGRVVVAELLKTGYPVRAMVHREDAHSRRLKAQGADPRHQSRSNGWNSKEETFACRNK